MDTLSWSQFFKLCAGYSRDITLPGNKTMKRGRQIVIAFLLFMTFETLIYTIYDGKGSYWRNKLSDDESDDPVPLTYPSRCLHGLFAGVSKNVKKVKQYLIGSSGPFLRPLGFTKSDKYNITRLVPVIVTAASSGHFTEAKAFFRHLESKVFPVTGRLDVVFFDIGLTRGQQNELSQMCNCTIRTFPFKTFPDHVRKLWGFAWKPLIIQMMLNEFGFVMWMDPSVTVTNATSLPAAYKVALTRGIAVTWSGEENPTTIAASTNTETFRMLRENPCMFRTAREFYASFIVIYRHSLIDQAIMRPWVSCALTDGCMVTEDIPHSTRCTKNDVYSECHHFDQSVLSIILHRMYPGDQRRPLIEMPVPWTNCESVNTLFFLPSSLNEYLYRRYTSEECKDIR